MPQLCGHVVDCPRGSFIAKVSVRSEIVVSLGLISGVNIVQPLVHAQHATVGTFSAMAAIGCLLLCPSCWWEGFHGPDI